MDSRFHWSETARTGVMARTPVNTEELQGVLEDLDGLGEDVTDPMLSPPGPPPLTAKVRSAASKLPESVEELFIIDPTGAAPRGGPDEKLEFFRQRVKVLEERFGQIKEAWQTHAQKAGQSEGEIEKVRAELTRKLEEQTKATEEARAQAAEAAEKLKSLQGFLNQKKEEFDAYGKSVKEAFAEKEKEKEKARRELDSTKAQVEVLRNEIKELKHNERDLRQEMEGRGDALKKQIARVEEKAQRKIDAAKHEFEADLAAAERKHKRELREREVELRRQVEAEATAKVKKEAEVAENELNEQIEILRDKLREAKTNAQGLTDASRDVEELKRDLEMRDDAIDKLKSTVKDMKKRLAESEAELARAGSGGGEALDPERQGKLQRAVDYAAKVITAAQQGQISRDQRAEVFKRASRAIQTAQDLVKDL